MYGWDLQQTWSGWPAGQEHWPVTWTTTLDPVHTLEREVLKGPAGLGHRSEGRTTPNPVDSCALPTKALLPDTVDLIDNTPPPCGPWGPEVRAWCVQGFAVGQGEAGSDELCNSGRRTFEFSMKATVAEAHWLYGLVDTRGGGGNITGDGGGETGRKG
eukprot:3761903-Pyramimonas_sp.AAC.1